MHDPVAVHHTQVMAGCGPDQIPKLEMNHCRVHFGEIAIEFVERVVGFTAGQFIGKVCIQNNVRSICQVEQDITYEHGFCPSWMAWSVLYVWNSRKVLYFSMSGPTTFV